MTGLWRRYWFSPAPCFDLAVVRVVVCAVQLFWVFYYNDQYRAIEERAALSDTF
jgi:hypothetical protein